MAWVWPISHLYCQPVARPPRPVCTKRPVRTLKFLLKVLQYGFVITLLILLVMWIGRLVEERAVDRAPSTMDIYAKPQVCGLMVPDNVFESVLKSSSAERKHAVPAHHRKLSSSAASQTFPNVSQAHVTANTIVAHCGDCGACSNPHDVKVYDETKETLTNTAFKCAKQGIVGGRLRTTTCIEKFVGLSEECTECWVENIFCTIGKCFFTCVWQRVVNLADRSQGGELNPCTRCDEMRCGRRFLDCAGANRRRVGIMSDIERDIDQEVCRNTDKDWWKNQELQLWWEGVMADAESAKPANDGDRLLLRRP